ncbi:MAG: beta-propeller domain-containing protein [Candidatus Gracilibacteria bacterium]|nr:beta-propeller domain-containing protein [Candidatus Gracilibacteria bacterium]
MKYTFFIPVILAFGMMASEVQAADVIVRNVNLGSCTTYSDGCNTHTVNGGIDTQTTHNTCIWEGIPQCLDSVNPAAKTLTADFKLKTFNSCDNMESVMKNFIKDYYKAHPYNGGFYGGGPIMMENNLGAVPAPVGVSSDAQKGATSGVSAPASATDISYTNLQVAGVDEPELIKTDGTNLYFYNSKDHSVYIAKAFPATELSVIKKIRIPESFVDPKLFLQGKKLIILGTKYNTLNYGYRYWFNRQVKTVVVVYDISDMNNLRIDKYYETDGNITESRMIGKYLYVLSDSNFSFPYDIYYGTTPPGAIPMLNETKFNADFVGSTIKPLKVELRKTDIASEKNFVLNGRLYPYNLTQKDNAICADIEYVLPDAETLKQFDFTPSLVTLSIIDTNDATKETKTKVLFGDVNQIHMSLNNLYITSHLYTSYDFRCAPGMLCIMPYYYQGQNTLIHKLSVKDDTASYVASAVIPGAPLNQYSMDEDNTTGNFRIVTSHSYPSQSTELFVLDPKLQVLGNLQDIGKGENFQSSRFIGNRLYLVTFKQIDPLFAIDLSDAQNPKILGELKIPGYSTYLHPYDATHLIGIGYTTITNQYGGTQNGGLKVDLYDVTDVANPKQVSTLTLGDQGSSSDVLQDPRLFTWYAQKNLLFMPAILMTNANDPTQPYRNKDAFQGTIALSIDPTNGVKEQARISHIDTTGLEAKRTEDCKQYAQTDGKPVCKTIIGGGEYCTNPVQTYVPPYCYTDSPIGEYFANQIWNFSNDFVIRNLYLDNTLITVSNDRIQANDIAQNYAKIGSVEMQ